MGIAWGLGGGGARVRTHTLPPPQPQAMMGGGRGILWCGRVPCNAFGGPNPQSLMRWGVGGGLEAG